MSFDLRIRFLGLGMFVPEPAVEEGGSKTPARMHVLLPSSEHGHGGHGNGNGGGGNAAADDGRHFVRIVYDKAYETQGSKQLTRTLKFVTMEKREMSLAGLVPEGEIELTIPDEICDVTPVAGILPDTVIGPNPGNGVIGRVTVDSGALTDWRLGAFFTLDGQPPRRMTTQAEWTVRGIEADSLAETALTGLNGAAAGTLPPLYPIGQTIHLMVFNAPAAEFPPHGEFHIVQPGLDADHFEHYYALYGKPVGPIPRAPEPSSIKDIRDVGVEPEPGAEVPAKGKETGATMTCINTTGSLKPKQ